MSIFGSNSISSNLNLFSLQIKISILQSVLDPNASQKNRQAGKAVRFTMEHSVEDFSKKYDCALVGLRPTASKSYYAPTITVYY